MKNIIEIASNEGIKESEVYYREVINNEIKFENNNLKNISTTQNSGIGIRGIYNNKMGITSFTHESHAKDAIIKLKESSKFSEPKEYEFSKPSEYSNPKIYSSEAEKISINKLVSDGEEILQKIKSYDKDILANIIFENEVETTKITNSYGVDCTYKNTSFVAYISGQLIDGTNFIDIDCYKYGIDSNYNKDILVNTFIEKMKLARTNAQIQAGATKVLFTPKAFGDILSTVNQGVNGNAIEKGISPLCNRIGEKIFDDRFTLIDDATVDNHLGSKPFDDEGVPTRKTLIIENGVLKSYVHSLKTATRTNSTPTGNGNRGSFASQPSPSLNNMIILPGNVTFEEMLEEMSNGIIIDEIMGLSMNNLLNGDFGGNIQLGYKVVNGKIVGRVKNAVFNSNIYKILKDNLISLSNLEYKHPVVSGVYSDKKQPCALFKDINITIK